MRPPRLCFFVSCLCCHLAIIRSETSPWKSIVARFLPRKFAKLRHEKLTANRSNILSCRNVDLFSRGGSSHRRRRRELFLDNSRQDEASDDEDELEEYVDEKLPLWKGVWASLPPGLQDGRQWGRWLASGMQIGLILYLVHAVWKAASDVLDEYYAAEQSGMDPPVFNREDVAVAMGHLRSAGSPSDASAVSWRGDERGTAALAIAQRLALVGVPLENKDDSKSVESILLSLSRNEANLLQECLWLPPRNESPAHLWGRIIGLDRVKRGLMSALATVQRQSTHAYSSLFDNSSAGVLLYGPPGCGKTMLGMSLSSMARIPCLLITPSVLLRKYVGETNQQCRTLFSLASKISPCIIMIDELDGLFRKRSDNEHEVSRELKTEFLQLWEGMQSRNTRTLVIGATNRPFDVDEAVLRRFTQSHLVGLPDVPARVRLLQRLLRDIPTAQNVDIEQLASQTETYSPSDLRRLLQTAAALGPLRDSMHHARPLTREDIQAAVQSVPATPLSPDYRHALANFVRSNQPTPVPNFMDHSQMDQREAYLWETDFGNYYHLGSLQVDAPSFDLLSNILERLSDMADDVTDDDDEDTDI